MTEQTGNGAEVAQRAAVPKGIEVARANLSRFDKVLPEHIPARQFVGAVEAAIWGDPKLAEAAQATPQSLYKALMTCASLGHIPASPEFWLIPFKDKGRPAVQGIEGYRGIIERMYRSGAVRSIIVREVCKGDQFEYVEGVHDKPRHAVDWFGLESSEGLRGDKDHPMIGVYAYAILEGNAVSRVVILSEADVMAAKATGTAGDSKYSPWNRLDGGRERPGLTGRSMWLKTAARRLEPWVPTSTEYLAQRLKASAEAAESARTRADQGPRGIDTATGEIHDAELVDEGAEAEAARAAEQSVAETAEGGGPDATP